MVNELIKKSPIIIGSFIVACFLLVFFYINEITRFIDTASLSGYSMVEAVNVFNGSLVESKNAFIPTSHHKDTSLIYWVYIVINTIFGIDPLYINYFFILFEFLLIPYSAFYFLKSIKNENPLLLSIVYTSILYYTKVQEYNWVNYGLLFHGEWYVIPNCIFLFILSSIIRKKFSTSIYLLLLSFLIHPTKGFAFILTLGPIILFHLYKNRDEIKNYIIPISVATSTSLLYVYFFIFSSKIQYMDSDLWIKITEAQSYHFLFQNFDSDFVIKSIIPIALMSLSISLRFKNTNLYPIGIGFFAIALIGKVFDLYSSSPVLVSLALHRFTENIILLSLLLLLLKSKNTYVHVFEFLAFYFLFFNISEINPYTIIFYLIGFSFLFKKEFDFTYLIIFTVLIMLYENNLYITEVKNLTSGKLLNQLFLILLHLLILYAVSLLLTKSRDYTKFFILILIFFCYNLYQEEYSDDPIYHLSMKENGYYEVQKWSQENTPLDAIFMPDPYIYYAWRDFSNRNSFGTPREFVTSWMYTRDNKTFIDSIKRASIFYDDPVEKMINNPKDYFVLPYAQAYYQADESKFIELCINFDVDYFVWKKEYTKPDYLVVVYEGETHYILELEKNCK